ncbi:hypothetical protein ACFX13_030794 [Malus domestica]
MMKLRHEDRPSPSRCATYCPKTSSITRSRLLAMKIVRNAFPKLLDKFANAPCSHKLKLHKPKLLVCKSLNCKTQGSSPA